ncbi:tautomerase family protein [Ancylobacter terrae]|uniref:tautomerase family protein n=1 Tax=Ancylobacter sp. sgz301288 TaxID=3342077 RepID=UPI003858BDE9
MPIIRVELLEGRSRAQKKEFAEVVTREASRILGCAPDVVDVVFVSISPDDWASAGRLVSEPDDPQG